jgi:formylglycine-generating enzyme
MTMLRIPAGKFFRIDERWRDAKAREVTLTCAFFLSDREVSVGLFRQFVDETKHDGGEPPEWGGRDVAASPTPSHPAQRVSWYEAVKFCNWLSDRENRTPCYKFTETKGRPETWELIAGADGYRLPTDDEWEYACRAGSGTAFTFGDEETLLGKYAVFSAGRAQTVGSKLPNPWGLFDVHGNVREWCQNWFDMFGEEPAVDAQVAGELSYQRIIRGGSWDCRPWGCRSAYADKIEPLIRSADLGFRVARSCAGSGSVQSGSR